MTGNRPELGRGSYGVSVVEIVRVRWGVLLVVWSPLHCVVDFPGRWLLRRLSQLLIHFLFSVDVNGAIFSAMVGFIAMVHAV
jgi:hypothetical protein